jgi:hypothetical protein
VVRGTCPVTVAAGTAIRPATRRLRGIAIASHPGDGAASTGA